ncbi:hypothetical protein FHW36_104327 [Chitinophaga polysaccharea]|uniref:Natural product n=1 Tax=Chitinophaga polysaccharea TaxID=1293035 RepID=A0A561PRC1_9BACT|nr:hypothetical protein [Chitinophaga polysaccharea]TWF40644.1 hypothetical protein FHW36_104327 [Chitinophaga polysaccharea]
MKKLKLTALDLGAKELLTREQLKNVMGGDGSGSGTGSCTYTQNCANGSVSCSSPTGDCSFIWDDTHTFTIGVKCDGDSHTCKS